MVVENGWNRGRKLGLWRMKKVSACLVLALVRVVEVASMEVWVEVGEG